MRGGLRALQRVVILAIVVLVVVGFVHAVQEETRDTGRSAWYVLVAGEDTIDWAGAPLWYDLTVPGLVLIALVIGFRGRIRRWFSRRGGRPRTPGSPPGRD